MPLKNFVTEPMQVQILTFLCVLGTLRCGFNSNQWNQSHWNANPSDSQGSREMFSLSRYSDSDLVQIHNIAGSIEKAIKAVRNDRTLRKTLSGGVEIIQDIVLGDVFQTEEILARFPNGDAEEVIIDCCEQAILMLDNSETSTRTDYRSQRSYFMEDEKTRLKEQFNGIKAIVEKNRKMRNSSLPYGGMPSTSGASSSSGGLFSNMGSSNRDAGSGWNSGAWNQRS